MRRSSGGLEYYSPGHKGWSQGRCVNSLRVVLAPHEMSPIGLSGLWSLEPWVGCSVCGCRSSGGLETRRQLRALGYYVIRRRFACRLRRARWQVCEAGGECYLLVDEGLGHAGSCHVWCQPWVILTCPAAIVFPFFEETVNGRDATVKLGLCWLLTPRRTR